MAEEKKEAEGQEAAPSGGRKPLLLVVAAALVAALAGAGGTWFLVRPDAEAAVTAEEAPEAAAHEPASGHGEKAEAESEHGATPATDSAPYQDRVFPLEPFVVNITGHEYARYLKLKIELEAESPAVRTELEGRLPQLRDAVILLLSSKRLSDITDFEGKALLKQDLLERINGLLQDGKVRDVLFTEFVVQ
jgi:flagellar FliL protein